MSTLDRIRYYLAAATQEKWEIIGGGEYITGVDVCIGSGEEGGIRLRDAELIVNAPTDLALLVGAIGAVEAALRDLSFTQDAGTPAVVPVEAVRAVLAEALGETL